MKGVFMYTARVSHTQSSPLVYPQAEVLFFYMASDLCPWPPIFLNGDPLCSPLLSLMK